MAFEPFVLVEDQFAPLPPSMPPKVVLFGDVDVSHAFVHANTSQSLGEMFNATVHLDANAPRVANVDFTSTVVIGFLVDGEIQRIFTGLVVSAAVADGLLEVFCQANPMLAEPLTGELVLKADGAEAIHAVARAAGLRDDQLDLQGLDEGPPDTFEVAAPVAGISVTEPVAFGDVTFVPLSHIRPVLRHLGDHGAVDRYLSHSTFAVTYVNAHRLFDAHLAGTRRIANAVSWVNVRLRYSVATTPNGQPHEWRRTRLRQRGTPVDLVAVRGVRTGRGWLKEEQPIVPEVSPLDHAATASAGAALADSRRLAPAARAISRAIIATDPVTRITAVSEALEFYAGKTHARADIQFTSAERKVLKASAAGFDDAKRKRVRDLLGWLNDPPFMARVRAQLALDGVPMVEGEMDALGRVRKLRNDLVHGKSDATDTADIDVAIALVARALMFGADRVRRDSSEATG